MTNDVKTDDEKRKSCPVPHSGYFSLLRKINARGQSSRKFPWKAFGGLGLVTVATFLSIYLALAVAFNYYRVVWWIIRGMLIDIPFKAVCTLAGIPFWPAKIAFNILFYAFKFAPSQPRAPVIIKALDAYVPIPEPTSVLTCLSAQELQPWQILTFRPGSDNNPATVKYTTNVPTPHAVSIIDIDYRDTQVDVISNGQFYGSTSDSALNKTTFCGADINECIKQEFSMGTFVIPGGKQSVELHWSGKDVLPGTDQIVWGDERKRRVMWKKDLCL